LLLFRTPTTAEQARKNAEITISGLGEFTGKFAGVVFTPKPTQ
jgi:hypothetical protein